MSQTQRRLAWLKSRLRGTLLHKALEEFRKMAQGRRELHARRTWTPHDHEMLSFYAQFISSADVCFDVGANVGNRTKIFLKLARKVIAVEPQLDCVACLTGTFGRNQKLVTIRQALGPEQREAEIMVSTASTISSFSAGWVESVRASGRFPTARWDRREAVTMTTLDHLIDRYGIPSFIKIDVEGFEYEVLQGLTRPVKALSIEFTPEYVEAGLRSINYLADLGPIMLNYSLGESMKFGLDHWISHTEMSAFLRDYAKGNSSFGDIYVRFVAQPR